MIGKSFLVLVFEVGPYRSTLDKKTKKNNKQFSIEFMKKTRKGSESSK